MIPRPRCIYIEPKIDDAAYLCTIEAEKSQSHHPARLRGYRKLSQHQLCKETRATNMKTYLWKKTLQCRWDTKQSRNTEILCRYVHEDRKQENSPVILSYGLGGKPNDTWIPMVHQHSGDYPYFETVYHSSSFQNLSKAPSFKEYLLREYPSWWRVWHSA